MVIPFNSADAVRHVYPDLVYLYFTCTTSCLNVCLCTTHVPWMLGIEPSVPNPRAVSFSSSWLVFQNAKPAWRS